jgi:hypothetical protein
MQKHIKNGAKSRKNTHLTPVWKRLWEILCGPLLENGQFPGYICPSKGQFPGICLKESQPLKRTFVGANDTYQANI